MTVDAIGALAAAAGHAAQSPEMNDALILPASANTAAPAAGAFGQLIGQGLDGVNQQLLASQTDLQQLATGNAQNLHQIMIRLEESRLSFQLLMQVRNRVLEAYQDVMKMQV
jgi:flagellar hook-basal body complex protein FliE